MSYSVDERPGYHGLKGLAREYLGAGFWEADRKKTKGSLSQLPKDVLYKYNAHDAAYTAMLVGVFKPWQLREQTRKVYEDIMIPAVNVFKEVQYHGCKVDKKRLGQFAREWGKWYFELEQELIDMARFYGWPADRDINLESTQQVAKFIYDILSLPMQPGKRGKGGQTVGARSTSQETLEALSGAHPFIDKLLEFRHVAHQFSVYVVGLDRNLKNDGRAHATVRLHGTVTGRLAYTDPPLQTIPRPYKFEDTFGLLRQLFIPTDPDNMVIIEADYGKAEIWCAYNYSQDPQLIADLLSGDYHSTVAADVLGKPYNQVTKRDRRDMKLITFGVMYGREAASLSDGIQQTKEKAQDYIDGFFRRNSQYASYIEQTVREATTKGELVSTFGRKRRFMFIGGSWDYRSTKQAVNYPIQSTTSDCTLSSFIELHEPLKAIGAHLLFTVHDSIILEAPKSRVEEACRLLHDVMTKERYPGLVRIPVELKVGPNWWAAKEAHNCEDPGGCLDARRDGIDDYVPEFKLA
jgi:DNA polymerase-1